MDNREHKPHPKAERHRSTRPELPTGPNLEINVAGGNPVILGVMQLRSSMEPPTFRYHPNPIATGAIARESAACICCGKAVDHVYVASAYSIHEFDRNLCPWCIADGSAHQKFDVEFTDSHPLFEAELDDEIITEVATRTPGYVSWQQEEWLTHCNDACAFLGDATPETVRNMTADEMGPLIAQHGVDSQWFADLAQHYQPGGQPAIYHFRCLHCKINLFGMDYT